MSISKIKPFGIVGRVSMDTITIDITKNRKSIKVGEYMELINHVHGIDKMAKECNTICDEILTSISDRVKRNLCLEYLVRILFIFFVANFLMQLLSQ